MIQARYPGSNNILDAIVRPHSLKTSKECDGHEDD